MSDSSRSPCFPPPQQPTDTQFRLLHDPTVPRRLFFLPGTCGSPLSSPFSPNSATVPSNTSTGSFNYQNTLSGKPKIQMCSGAAAGTAANGTAANGTAANGTAATGARSAADPPATKSKKRKSAEDDGDESMGVVSSGTAQERSMPMTAITGGHLSEGAFPGTKRAKTGEGRPFSLSKLLETLNKERLIQLIGSLADQYPQLQSQITSHIPRPTLQTVQPVFQQFERKIQEAFPYTKWGPSKDDYSFNRVRPVLTEIKDTVLDYSAHFVSTEEFPTTTFTYLYQATCFALRLPEWDRAENNTLKYELVEHLIEDYQSAVQNAAEKCSEGKVFGMQVVDEWGRGLFQHWTEVKSLDSEKASKISSSPSPKRCPIAPSISTVLQQFVQKLGWMCSSHTLLQIQSATTL